MVKTMIKLGGNVLVFISMAFSIGLVVLLDGEPYYQFCILLTFIIFTVFMAVISND